MSHKSELAVEEGLPLNRENWELNIQIQRSVRSINLVGLNGPTVNHPIPTLFDNNKCGKF